MATDDSMVKTSVRYWYKEVFDSDTEVKMESPTPIAMGLDYSVANNISNWL